MGALAVLPLSLLTGQRSAQVSRWALHHTLRLCTELSMFFMIPMSPCDLRLSGPEGSSPLVRQSDGGYITGNLFATAPLILFSIFAKVGGPLSSASPSLSSSILPLGTCSDCSPEKDDRWPRDGIALVRVVWRRQRLQRPCHSMARHGVSCKRQGLEKHVACHPSPPP